MPNYHEDIPAYNDHSDAYTDDHQDGFWGDWPDWGNIPYQESHEDATHTDTHWDNEIPPGMPEHEDIHTDETYPHVDQHTDEPHYDYNDHYDVPEYNDHTDSHTNTHNDSGHTDIHTDEPPKLGARFGNIPHKLASGRVI